MRPLIFLFALGLNATTFQSSGLFPMTNQPLQPLRILSADMNRDGFSDLVTIYTSPGGFFNSSVSIALGSRGGFASSFNETIVQGEAIDAQTADFTGDGFPDVLILTGSALCLAGGNGLGFVSGVSCSALSEPGGRLAIGDFNGDGFQDAAVTLPVSARVGVWFNRLDRTFGPGPTAPVASPGVIAATDLNTDGFTDLIVQSRAGQLHIVISGQGPSINIAQSIAIPVSVSDIALGDFTRDRRADIMLANPAGSAYLTLAATGSATPYFAPPMTSTSLAAPNLLQLADFNGDGVPEIFAATNAGMLIAGIGATGAVSTPPLPGFGVASSVRFAVVDFNSDGILDIATAGPHAGSAVSIFVGTPTLTTTVMEVAPNTLFGQRTTINVRVQVNTPPFPVTALASGRITLFRNGVSLQDAPVTPIALPEVLAAGARDVASARFEIVLPVGVYDLAAGFSGTAGFAASSAPAVRVSIQAVPTTIRLTTSSNEIQRDQGLRVGATVLGPLAPAVEGTVRLAVNGAVVSQGLVNAGAAQLFIPPGLPVGKIKVKLTYEGTGYQPSETSEIDFVVRTTLTAAHAATFRSPVPSDGFATITLPGFVNTATLGRITAEFRQPGLPTIATSVTFVGDGQVNVYIPAGVQAGTRTLHVLQDGASIASGEVTVARVAPGMFTVDGVVDGVPAAYAALYSADGGVRNIPVLDCGSGRCVAAPMSPGGDGETLVVSIFGTGWRNAARVTALIANTTAEVLFAGAHPVTPGLDQINVVIPKSLARRGEVEVVLAADGNTSNRAKIVIQ
ncbi:MAG: hypothetical protein FJW38_01355 [Acidobacteria bacterium]|nr:hypothetical protein [Acidobacteriota bacterium]